LHSDHFEKRSPGLESSSVSNILRHDLPVHHLWKLAKQCFPYFGKITAGLCDRHAVCLHIPSPHQILTPDPLFIKLGMYITAPEPISTAYFINPSHQSVCLYVYRPIVARQRLGINVTGEKTKHATEDLSEAFWMRSVTYQKKAGD
jgi:hypothetical protein